MNGELNIEAMEVSEAIDLLDSRAKALENYIAKNEKAIQNLDDKDKKKMLSERKMKKYYDILDDIEKAKQDLEEVNINIDDLLEDENELVEKAEIDKLLDKTNYVNDKAISVNKKTVGKVIGSVILVAAICITANQISKQIKNTDNSKNPTDPYENSDVDKTNSGEETPAPEETPEPTPQVISDVEALMAKGYDEYTATLMVENFSEEAIERLKTIYIEAAKNYATEKEFIVDYINDYENARTIFNITSDKAVDYVNRAYEISKTGFYTDATINDIAEILMAVDRKEILNAENDSLYNAICMPLNDIYNGFLSNTNNEASLQKLDALTYFAKEGSELDMFLTEFVTLNKNILTQNDDASRTAMYEYLDDFANTYLGNTEGYEDANPNAVIIDNFDWNIAYKTFISPLMSMYITEQNVEDYVCLQLNMLSTYEEWAEVNLCGDELVLSLGGE